MGARWRWVVAVTASIAMPGFVIATHRAAGAGAERAAAAATAAESGASFVGMEPARLLDSRAGAATVDGASAGGGMLAAKSVTVVPVGGRAGVPGGAATAALNVTVADATGAGYASVYPCGAAPPNASNVNFVAGQTIANAALVRLGQGAAACVYVSEAAHVIVDIGGYVPVDASFVGTTPARLADSRPGAATADGRLAGGGAHPAGTVLEVPIDGRAGLPGNASAVALNLTVTDAVAGGYASAYPCGSAPPNASNLNFDAAQTIAGGAVVEVGDGAAVCVYLSASAQLIVDVGGYFPVDASFVGMVPARLLDSRPGAATVDGESAGGGAHPAESVTTVPVAGRAGVLGNAATAVLNVTVTDGAGGGYASVYPCGAAPPNASNLNFAAGQTIANAAVVRLGDGGAVCVFVSAATQVIVDVAGYFPAATGPPTTEPPTTEPPITAPPTTTPVDSVPPEPIPFAAGEVFSLASSASPYWIYVPEGYDATHETPTTLFVWLHGCGGYGRWDIYNVSPGGDQDWISIAVGGREGQCWSMADSPATVNAAIADVKRHFNVDPREVILGGYSSGGDLAYRMAFSDAGSFAGVLAENTAPFRDTGSSAEDSLAAASWKFNVVHLAHLQDTTYPIARVRAEIAAMVDAGFPVTLIERPGNHWDDPGAPVNGAPVPGTNADLIDLLLPYLGHGWRSP